MLFSFHSISILLSFTQLLSAGSATLVYQPFEKMWNFFFLLWLNFSLIFQPKAHYWFFNVRSFIDAISFNCRMRLNITYYSFLFWDSHSVFRLSLCLFLNETFSEPFQFNGQIFNLSVLITGCTHTHTQSDIVIQEESS